MDSRIPYACRGFLHLNQRRGHAESAIRLGRKKSNSEINSNCTGWEYVEGINIKLISDRVSSTKCWSCFVPMIRNLSEFRMT